MNKLTMTILTIGLGALMMLQTPAMAAVTDQAVYNSLKQRRMSLTAKEADLYRKRDSMERVFDDLNRRNDHNQYNSRLDELKKELDFNSQDIQKIQLDIRDIDRALA